MKIAKGYNDKETEIRVSTQGNGSIELWINQTGVEDRERLAYMTPTELHELFEEVQRAGIDLFT